MKKDKIAEWIIVGMVIGMIIGVVGGYFIGNIIAKSNALLEAKNCVYACQNIWGNIKLSCFENCFRW